MAASSTKPITLISLILAGVVSGFVSLWGLMAGAWGGFDNPPLTAKLFWLLPSLSLPVFWIYFINRKIGCFSSWLISAGFYLVVLAMNWRSCAAGNCTTTNLIKVAAGALVAVPTLWGQIVAAVLMQSVSIRDNNIPANSNRNIEGP